MCIPTKINEKGEQGGRVNKINWAPMGSLKLWCLRRAQKQRKDHAKNETNRFLEKEQSKYAHSHRLHILSSSSSVKGYWKSNNRQVRPWQDQRDHHRPEFIWNRFEHTPREKPYIPYFPVFSHEQFWCCPPFDDLH